MLIRKLQVVGVLTLLFPAHDAAAWGSDGHKLVCALARQQLTEQAITMVDRLLADGAALEGGIVKFPEACIWADQVKHTNRLDTYEEHYLNVPDDAGFIDLNRDCPALDCIAVGIQRALINLSRMASGKREVARKAAALRYLGHYVGDLHQPLHISYRSDRGGNRIRVTWYGKHTNLHRLWDTGLLHRYDLRHPDSLDFLSSIKPGQLIPEEVVGMDQVLDWMNESLRLARSHAYMDHQGALIKSGDRLGSDYLNRNKPVVIKQLTLAGARLAILLNQIAAGDKVLAPLEWEVD